jgi:aminopeptidase N
LTAEITRVETSRRARLVRVHSYAIALDLTRGADVFGSISVVRFDCAEPGGATYIDLLANAVREITLNGVSLDPAAAYADGRITLPGLTARNELRVEADCVYAGSGTGMHRSADSADGGTYIYGKLAQAYARTAYACFDQPDLKAEFTFQVTAPAQWTVLSNQPAVGAPEPVGDGSAVWGFLPTPRLPTFTTTVVAGDYHVVTASHTTPSGQQIPLELACRAGLAGHLDSEALFDVTRQGLDFYTSVLDVEYPYAKYGQVFVPELSCQASEDAGCVLVSERFVYRSRVTAVMDEMRAGTLLHEMAHMWFGDLVTQQWWDDLWLSESFADFCEYESTSRLGRFPHAWSTFSVAEKTWGFAQDQLPSTHPVAANSATLSDAIANFDGISYAKGAAVLRQLAAYVGQDNFFAGVRVYITEHAFANAQLPDLIAAVAASSGKDLAAWSKAWLETAGPNTLRCQFRTDASGAFNEFAIVQDAPIQHPTLRPHRIAVGLYQHCDGALTRTHRVEADVTGARTVVSELAGLVQPDLILLNDDDTGYVIVRFDPRSLSTVIESIGELTDSAARAVCWNTAIDMVRQAELPVSAFVAMLATGIHREYSLSVLQALLTQAEQILTQLADPQQASEGKQQLADVAGPMLAVAHPASDHQLVWAQLLSWTATSTDQLDLIARMLDGSSAVPGLSINAELRWSLLQRLAAMGRADDASVDGELARDPTDAGRRNAAACRAAIPDAQHKDTAWELLTSGRLGPESLTAIARGFTQPEHAHLLIPYAGCYLTELERIWVTRSSHLRVQLSELLFPYPAASADLLTKIDDFLSTPRDPALTRVLTERRDAVQRALRSRALPH